MSRVVNSIFVASTLVLSGPAAPAPAADTDSFDYDRVIDPVVARYHLPGMAVRSVENN